MRVRCFYSGVAFSVSNSFNRINTVSLSERRNSSIEENHLETHRERESNRNISHPIMNVPARVLLPIIKDWADGELTEEENRLLFIALLKASELVNFKVTPIPERNIIANNMESLLELVTWRTYSKVSLSIPAPTYCISLETRSLKNIRHWIEEVNYARKDFEASGSRWEKHDKLILRERALQKLIKSSKAISSYSTILAKWVMEASNAPEERIEEWMKLFSLKDFIPMCNASSESIESLLDHMIKELDARTIMANTAFRHIRKLQKVNKAGMIKGVTDDNFEEVFGGDNFNLSDFEIREEDDEEEDGEDLEENENERKEIKEILSKDEERNKEFLANRKKFKNSGNSNGYSYTYGNRFYKVVSSSKEVGGGKDKFIIPNTRNIKEEEAINKVISSAPKDKPVEKDYVKKVDYLKARGAWDLMQMEEKRKKIIENKLSGKI